MGIPQHRELFPASRLCAILGAMGDWEGAHGYAKAASASRREAPSGLFMRDFGRHHEVEAVIRGGNEKLAREEVRRLGENVNENRRFRLAHLRVRAALARWSGGPEEALRRLREAAALADEMGLPDESWEIQASLGDLLHERGKHQAVREAFGRAATTLSTLAGRIGDEKLREASLWAPPVRRVLERP